MQNNLGFNASLQVAGKNYSYAITAFKKKKKTTFGILQWGGYAL